MLDFVVCFEFKHHFVNDTIMISSYKFNIFLISVCNSLFCFMNKHRATFLEHFAPIKAVFVHFFVFYTLCLTFGSECIWIKFVSFQPYKLAQISNATFGKVAVVVHLIIEVMMIYLKLNRKLY